MLGWARVQNIGKEKTNNLLKIVSVLKDASKFNHRKTQHT